MGHVGIRRHIGIVCARGSSGCGHCGRLYPRHSIVDLLHTLLRHSVWWLVHAVTLSLTLLLLGSDNGRRLHWVLGDVVRWRCDVISSSRVCVARICILSLLLILTVIHHPLSTVSSTSVEERPRRVILTPRVVSTRFCLDP